MGSLLVGGSWTSRAICASAVSEPTRVASTTNRPPALTVAPVTGSPDPTSTGTGSPVRSEARSEEHTSELQSLMRNSYAVFCLQINSSDPIYCETHTGGNIRNHHD